MYFQTAENANDRAVPETDLFCQRIQRRSSSNSKSISKARVRVLRARAHVHARYRAIFAFLLFFCTKRLCYEQRRMRYAGSYYAHESMSQMNPQSVIGASSSTEIHHRITNDAAHPANDQRAADDSPHDGAPNGFARFALRVPYV